MCIYIYTHIDAYYYTIFLLHYCMNYTAIFCILVFMHCENTMLFPSYISDIMKFIEYSLKILLHQNRIARLCDSTMMLLSDSMVFDENSCILDCCIITLLYFYAHYIFKELKCLNAKLC